MQKQQATIEQAFAAMKNNEDQIMIAICQIAAEIKADYPLLTQERVLEMAAEVYGNFAAKKFQERFTI